MSIYGLIGLQLINHLSGNTFLGFGREEKKKKGLCSNNDVGEYGITTTQIKFFRVLCSFVNFSIEGFKMLYIINCMYIS